MKKESNPPAPKNAKPVAPPGPPPVRAKAEAREHDANDPVTSISSVGLSLMRGNTIDLPQFPGLFIKTEPVQYGGAISHEATVREMAARAEKAEREKEALRELLEAVEDHIESDSARTWHRLADAHDAYVKTKEKRDE